MATRYHINYDGKIYPCRTKVMKCPYSESLHSENKVELYYKLMIEDKGEIEPSKGGLSEIEAQNRLRDLSSLSDDIAKSNAPVELIIHTLGEGLDHVSKIDIEKLDDKRRNIANNHAEEIYELLKLGVPIPSNVPDKIIQRADFFLDLRDNGVSKGFEESLYLMKRLDKIKRTDYSDYYKYTDGLNKDNYEETYEWMSEDFEKFARDLNASKMMTQPVFFGNLEQAKETIKNMGNFELISAFDDYSLSKKEIEDSIKEANYFEYTDRSDLSKDANKALRTWYNRNREIYKSWKINSSKRILLSMEIADELDRREILRTDKNVGALLDDYESE